MPATFVSRAAAWVVDAVPHAIVPFVAGRLTDSTPVGIAAFLVIGIVWSILPEARAGATIGKLLLGIRVVGVRDDGPIGLARAAVRWIVKYPVSGALPVGYLWFFRDATRRTWHDHAAGTLVVAAATAGPASPG